jgi:hypothetical protein
MPSVVVLLTFIASAHLARWRNVDFPLHESHHVSQNFLKQVFLPPLNFKFTFLDSPACSSELVLQLEIYLWIKEHLIFLGYKIFWNNITWCINSAVCHWWIERVTKKLMMTCKEQRIYSDIFLMMWKINAHAKNQYMKHKYLKYQNVFFSL